MYVQQLVAYWPLLVGLSQAAAQQSSFDVLDYIDPLIGTANGGKNFGSNDMQLFAILICITGHVFPGATLPCEYIAQNKNFPLMAKAETDLTNSN